METSRELAILKEVGGSTARVTVIKGDVFLPRGDVFPYPGHESLPAGHIMCAGHLVTERVFTGQTFTYFEALS